MGKPIYVEIAIRAPLDELWRLTQSPDLHQRWDLRFTRIAYLPRPGSRPAPALPLRRFGIEVTVTNRAWGRLFGYRGWFTAKWPACRPGAAPPHIRPRREERRE